VPFQRLEVAVDPKIATATLNARKEDESRFDIVLSANPELPPGNFHTDARFLVVTPTGEKVRGATLPLGGTMQPEVRLLPSRLLLQAKPVGDMTEAFVTMQAAPDAKITVDHIEIDDPDVHVESATVEGIPKGLVFRVCQKVIKEGEQASDIRFVIRKPDKKLSTQTVRVCCRGEAKSAVSATRGMEP
jgi:hypothetical protein